MRQKGFFSTLAMIVLAATASVISAQSPLQVQLSSVHDQLRIVDQNLGHVQNHLQTLKHQQATASNLHQQHLNQTAYYQKQAARYPKGEVPQSITANIAHHQLEAQKQAGQLQALGVQQAQLLTTQAQLQKQKQDLLSHQNALTQALAAKHTTPTPHVASVTPAPQPTKVASVPVKPATPAAAPKATTGPTFVAPPLPRQITDPAEFKQAVQNSIDLVSQVSGLFDGVSLFAGTLGQGNFRDWSISTAVNSIADGLTSALSKAFSSKK